MAPCPQTFDCSSNRFAVRILSIMGVSVAKLSLWSEEEAVRWFFRKYSETMTASFFLF